MKADQERVRNLLSDTVTMLCKNGITYQQELRVEGLIAITVDHSEVFVVHIDQKYPGEGQKNSDGDAEAVERKEDEETSESISVTSRPLKRRLGDFRERHKSHGQRTIHRTHRHSGQSPQSSNEERTNSRHSSQSQSHDTTQSDLEESRIPELGDVKIKVEEEDPDLLIVASSEPPTKRRTVTGNASESDLLGADGDSNSVDSSGNAFITGIVPNVYQPSQDASWMGVSHGPDGQLLDTGGGQLSAVDSLPGCSSWSSQPPGPGQQSDMAVPSVDSQETDVYLHECPFCQKHYSKLQSLQRHIQDRHSPKRFWCDVCSYETNRAPDMQRHKSRKHGCKLDKTSSSFG